MAMVTATGVLERQLVVFDLAGEAYGVEIQAVREIIRHQTPTIVPSAPPAVDGVINLRGNVIPVVDLRKLLGLRIQPVSGTTRIVVVDIQGQSVGVIVDAVTEVLRLSADKVEGAPSMAVTENSYYIDGIVNANNRLMILLNLDRALSIDSIQQAQVDEAQYAQPATAQRAPAAAPGEGEQPSLADLDIGLLEHTFELVKPRGAELVEYFYARLFEEYPAVIPLFERADMQEQQGKLLAAIALVVASLRNPEALIPALQRLGERHVEYGALAPHYDAVGAMLLESLAYIAGDAWNDTVARAWSDAYAVVATVMRDAAARFAEQQAA